jgi:hypothetical protein
MNQATVKNKYGFFELVEKPMPEDLKCFLYGSILSK